MDRQHLMKMAMLALAMVALVYIASVCSRKNKVENFENHDGDEDPAPESANDDFQQDVDEEGHDSEDAEEPEHFTSGGGHVEGVGSGGAEAGYHPVASDERNGRPADCFPKDQLTPGELLPGDANSKWSESVPTGQGDLSDQNFLTAGYHVGVNTVGQTLRNANRQIRSEPPNPQVKVSPWLQTTIETDTNRRPLEIGGCQ